MFFQLVSQVGHHAAWYLVDLYAGIDAGELTLVLVVLLAYGVEVHADFLQQLQIQTGVEFGALECGNHGFGARVAGAPGHGGDSGVDMVGAALDCLELAHGSQTSGIVRVDEHRQVEFGF